MWRGGWAAAGKRLPYTQLGTRDLGYSAILGRCGWTGQGENS